MTHDVYDPTSYPEHPSAGSLAAIWVHQDGYRDQWRLIAEHIVEGGVLEDVPRPRLDQYRRGFEVFAVQGILVARDDAFSAIKMGVYDPHVVLESFREEMEELQADQARWAERTGSPVPPDLSTARRHTTIPRLFTDSLVHDVQGQEYRPKVFARKSAVLPKGSRLLGYKEHDLWFDISGSVVCEVAAGGPDTSYGTCMKVAWAGAGQVVAAVEIGDVGGSSARLGVGAPGANELREDRRVEQALYSGDIPSVVSHPFYGDSVWFFDSNKDATYGVYLGLDADDLPAALYFDATAVAGYWEKDFYEDDDDGDYEQAYGPWPDGAREFDPSRDRAF